MHLGKGIVATAIIVLIGLALAANNKIPGLDFSKVPPKA